MNEQSRIFIAATLVIALQISPGCATPLGSAGLGATAGGLAGAGVGAIADPGKHGDNRLRNVMIGTAVGAAVGAGAGYVLDRFVHNERESAAKDAKAQEAREAESHAALSQGLEPRLLPARTEARWVHDQVRGTTFVPGHFEYLIVEGAKWQMDK